MNEDHPLYNDLDKIYWISPDGMPYYLSEEDLEDVISIHWKIASNLFPSLDDPENALFSMGWGRVGFLGKYKEVYIDDFPTQAIINYCDEKGLSIFQYINHQYVKVN